MKNMMILLLALLFTLGIVIYQRLTGPTHPKHFKLETKDQEVSIQLPRSHISEQDCEIKLPANIDAKIYYKKFPGLPGENWTQLIFLKNTNFSRTTLPKQPPAGKLQYYITLTNQAGITQAFGSRESPIVIRFRGTVPDFVLLPHILFMFLAFFLNNLCGLQTIFRGKNIRLLGLLTLISLSLGGLLLGPIVQKFAFGAFWTGFPLGKDLTDTKTLAAALIWFIALLKNRKQLNRKWILGASLALILIYLIPHSMMGSELDHTTGKIKTG